MSMINSYCTLADFKGEITPPGQTLNPDAVDDVEIEKIIIRASRKVDDIMGRVFYPRIATRLYDLPRGRDLWLGDDFLAAITLTNGDATVITSTDYKLHPANEYPKYLLSLKETSSELWSEDSTGNTEQVISLAAYWGYHEEYATRAWKSGGTLGAAIADTTGLSFTLTAGHTLATGGGQVVKIDNELFNSVSAAATTLTVIARGDNGSTAATHLNGATVYYWQPMEDITGLTLDIANMMYKARYQPQAVESDTRISGAGVVISPRSLPSSAPDLIKKYKRRV